MTFTKPILLIFTLLFSFTACSQHKTPIFVEYDEIVSGDQQLNEYLPLLQNKAVGIVANHASFINGTHLVDTLLKRGVNIISIFSPEHGFRGEEDAGSFISDNKDSAIGIPIISLYGDHKKPTVEDLQNTDVVLFDLQDVGVRFYTYISTLTYIMEACAENDVPMIVLDRPNPNGFYVDGPVLKEEFTSFVGLHKVPIVYGMTIGEYALMVNGEEWLKENLRCDLTIIPLRNYNHNYMVNLPIKPSPNLPNWEAVYLYPSLCLFEGTIMSVGRGTDYPFQVYGHPDFQNGNFMFIPESKPGATNPKYKGIECNGQNLVDYAKYYDKTPPKINLTWLIKSYKMLSPNHEFFISYFDKLAGTDELRKQIESGLTEIEIRESWQKDIDDFKKIREKYLLYD